MAIRNDAPLGREVSISQDQDAIAFRNSDGDLSFRLDDAESPRARWVGSALVISLQQAGEAGAWEDLLVCSIDHRGLLNVVHVATLKSVEPVMGTRVLTYARAPGE